MVTTDEATPPEPYRQPLMLPQFKTETILREKLAEFGEFPRFGWALAGLAQDDEGITATLTQAGKTRTVRARYLVGADGGRSFVRSALGIEFPGKTLPLRGIVVDVELEGMDADHCHRWGENPEEQFMITPLRGTSLFQIQAAVPAKGEPDLSIGGLTALIGQRTRNAAITIHSVSWASGYQVNMRIADRYRVGRVFLVGDAAHVHPPTGGQGLNTSVQDAYNLGWKLATVLRGGSPSLLDTYEEERRPIAVEMVEMAGRLLAALRETGSLHRGRETHQLDLNYRSSSLSPGGHVADAILCPGDRAPDAPCRGAGGQSTRLFTLFQGTHWTLLASELCGARLPAAREGLRIHLVGEYGDVHDSNGHIAAAYPVLRNGWVLVRPDGYVGAIGEATDMAALSHALDSHLPPLTPFLMSHLSGERRG